MVERTTITLLLSQKKIIDRARAQHLLETNENLNQKEFFGLMLQYYQDHRACLEDIKIQKVLERNKK